MVIMTVVTIMTITTIIKIIMIILAPAEPEPPPAHSIGRVVEDAMGRPGQFVKPCWLGAGGVALVVRNCWGGW